jgi:hypothetical protein
VAGFLGGLECRGAGIGVAGRDLDVNLIGCGDVFAGWSHVVGLELVELVVLGER